MPLFSEHLLIAVWHVNGFFLVRPLFKSNPVKQKAYYRVLPVLLNFGFGNLAALELFHLIAASPIFQKTAGSLLKRQKPRFFDIDDLLDMFCSKKSWAGED